MSLFRVTGAIGVPTHYTESRYEQRPGFEYMGEGSTRGLTLLAPLQFWYSSCGRIDLRMTLEQAQGVAGVGAQDDNVRELTKDRGIAEQLAEIDAGELAEELKGYGAWDAAELADHAQNLQRLVWLAGCDIAEETHA